MRIDFNIDKIFTIILKNIMKVSKFINKVDGIFIETNIDNMKKDTITNERVLNIAESIGRYIIL